MPNCLGKLFQKEREYACLVGEKAIAMISEQVTSNVNSYAFVGSIVDVGGDAVYEEEPP